MTKSGIKRLYNFTHEPSNKNQSTHINIDIVQDRDTKLWHIRVNDQPYGTIENIDSVQIFGDKKITGKITKDERLYEK